MGKVREETRKTGNLRIVLDRVRVGVDEEKTDENNRICYPRTGLLGAKGSKVTARNVTADTMKLWISYPQKNHV